MENKERVLGIGGVFFKAQDPKALLAWYRTHLGVPGSEDFGAIFTSQGPGDMTLWAPFRRDANYFSPSQAPFMLNFRVAHLDRMLDQLRAEGVQVDGRTESSEFGRFGWLMDPEGNRVELWEPPGGGS